jgi:hypothetical protein
MTKDSDFKRLVRDRAARTGESYQAALRQIRPTDPSSGRHDLSDLAVEFERIGIVKLEGVFTHDMAAAMREAVWEAWADEYGVRRDDPSTWASVHRWKTIKAAKRDPSFREILGDRLRAFADFLLGPSWSTSNGLGELLASVPDAPRWHLPGSDGRWHSDYPYGMSMDPIAGLRVFAVFGDVPATGGGTLLVQGSHRMVDRFVRTQPGVAAARAKVARAACHNSNNWLRDLTNDNGHEPGRVERFMMTVTEVDGIAARVIEASGEPGDVYVCHPWTIHCAAPNANTQPRFLRGLTLSRRERHTPPAPAAPEVET